MSDRGTRTKRSRRSLMDRILSVTVTLGAASQFVAAVATGGGERAAHLAAMFSMLVWLEVQRP